MAIYIFKDGFEYQCDTMDTDTYKKLAIEHGNLVEIKGNVRRYLKNGKWKVIKDGKNKLVSNKGLHNM